MTECSPHLNASPIEFTSDTVVTRHQATPTGANEDIEASATSPSTVKDPFQIRDGIVAEQELAGLRRRKRGKSIAEYQSQQNSLILDLLKPMDELSEDAKEGEAAIRFPVKIAVYASLIANVVLCILQLYAAITAGSLSLLATGLDAVFDVGSNVVLFWLHKKAAKLDKSKWPVGGARLETIGNILYGFLMASVNLIVIVESARNLITMQESATFHLASIVSVAAALAVKFALFLYCYSLRVKSSQVQVLWQDHRNDLFINGFGILMSTGGSKFKWYLDPMGAIIISLGVIASWACTVYYEFGLLAGKAAPHSFLQLIIYKAATFSEDIIKIDTVRAYHSGPDYFVEVDVVMDENTPLWKAHDISEQLQDKIEVLPNVERAFVHVDHEWTHAPEHRKSPKKAAL